MKKASLWHVPPFPGVHVMKAPEPFGVTLMFSGVLGRSRCCSVGVGVMVAVGVEVVVGVGVRVGVGVVVGVEVAME